MVFGFGLSVALVLAPAALTPVGAQTAQIVAALTGNAVIPVQSTGKNHAAIPITYEATAGVEVALIRVGKGS
jgi:hypothetical protein